ncbi:uridine diphosphate-N-acetylglucosamine-binding protein YvcK [Anaerolineae bacterium CFX9]|nr:uridine diphosphate-N-acetylglucosamine-binding protein YvcK [Anaerolineae bacterium CFX9]
MSSLGNLSKWLVPGIGVKRWVLVLLSGIVLMALSLALGVIKFAEVTLESIITSIGWLEISLGIIIGAVFVGIAFVRLSNTILTPYRRHQNGRVIDVVYAHSKRTRGVKVVAIGGGTGLPSVLRSLKAFTSNITAVVTVADDGGSSGRLRRDLGVLPPGDLRNNIAALADDESLMTQLFQYRFNKGDLGGHSFGNLFITAMSGVTGSLESALVETERVLNIQGRVLPATMEDVQLEADVIVPGSERPVRVRGESRITEAGGQIQQMYLHPDDVEAYTGSVQAILNADIVVLGPGSLFTSLIPNILVPGIAEALRATQAYKIYVCNIATQPGETDNFTVAEHIIALEKHLGRGVFQLVLANNAYPVENAGEFTHYVSPVPDHHEVLQRYEVRYVDLVDNERPWRHDPQKLAVAILSFGHAERSGAPAPDPDRITQEFAR